MVRGVDNNGCLLLALNRSEIEQLLRGERICSNPHPRQAPGPHLCIFGGETDEDCLRNMDKAYPIGTLLPVGDMRGRPEYLKHPDKGE